ncbi:MAG: hypothetical protein JST68_29580 [Bacteroidetes bacterium]|nr:hypothetical protein [Bacteroidota bacterium]
MPDRSTRWISAITAWPDQLMKNIITKLLLFLYVSLLLRPFSPFLADALAHTFWYARHMATVHYEHGKFHVHYEYVDALAKSIPDRPDHTIREIVSVGDHLLINLHWDFTLPQTHPSPVSKYTLYFPRVFVAGDDPPPRHRSPSA